jgi:hypothetical protein
MIKTEPRRLVCHALLERSPTALSKLHLFNDLTIDFGAHFLSLSGSDATTG